MKALCHIIKNYISGKECILKINEYNAKIHQKQAVIAAVVIATAYTSTIVRKRKYKKK